MDGECFSFIVAHVAADVFAAACIGECVEQAIARGAVFGGTIDNHGTVARIGLEVGMCIVCSPSLSLVVRNVELSSARTSHADQDVAIVELHEFGFIASIPCWLRRFDFPGFSVVVGHAGIIRKTVLSRNLCGNSNHEDAIARANATSGCEQHGSPFTGYWVTAFCTIEAMGDFHWFCPCLAIVVTVYLVFSERFFSCAIKKSGFSAVVENDETAVFVFKDCGIAISDCARFVASNADWIAPCLSVVCATIDIEVYVLWQVYVVVDASVGHCDQGAIVGRDDGWNAIVL